jgi:hypothetical protein
VTNTEIVVVWDQKNIKILDTNGQLISHVPELDEHERFTWNLSCCLSVDQMAVLSQSSELSVYGQEKLSLWDVSDPLRVIRLKSRHFSLRLPFSTFTPSMKMDDQFIVVPSFQSETSNFYFFSKKTLDLHWQKTVDGNMRDSFAYGKGLLLFYVLKENEGHEECGVIEVYDVKSRKCIREMSIARKYSYYKFKNHVGFNSKFMIVFEKRLPFKMNIYDLEAIKNPNSSADELLVHISAVDFHCQKIVVTETEIFCLDWETFTVLDFSSINVFQNATKSVTLSLPWRSVWRSKGVDEEPLEPVHHMEAYREILKYFHELSTNTQKAIETCPLLYPPFFSDSDFINDKQLASVVCIKEMNNESQKMNDKTVLINKNTHGSVMRIQLIDVTTGCITDKMMKLNIHAIDCHMGGNLLVSVSKMAEHEHLLRVWRLEKSLKLTRVKDLLIEDYDSLQIDEQFIALHVPNEHTDMTFNFISMKTFQVERSLTCYYETSYYDGGYLFLMNSDCLVRILDVASGTFLHDIRMEPSSFDSIIFRVNSNYVVTAITKNGYNEHSKLYVYDLKCLKETDVVPSHLLLTSIDLKCKVTRITMNESRIVCRSLFHLKVIDLKHIDRMRCPESC